MSALASNFLLNQMLTINSQNYTAVDRQQRAQETAAGHPEEAVEKRAYPHPLPPFSSPFAPALPPCHSKFLSHPPVPHRTSQAKAQPLASHASPTPFCAAPQQTLKRLRSRVLTSVGGPQHHRGNMYHDDRTERNYPRDRRYDQRYERYDSRYDPRYESRYDNRYDRRYDRNDTYRNESYHRSGYDRRDYGRSGNSGYQAPRRENPPMTREQLERRVYCHNLSYRSSWQDLKDYMRQAGDVEHVRIMEDSEGRSRGCAVVMFTTKEGARKAIKTLNDTQFGGRSIFVREDRAYSERKSSKDSRGRGSYSESSSDSGSGSYKRSSRHRRGKSSRSRSRSRSRSQSSRSSSEDRRSRDASSDRSPSRADDRASSRDERREEEGTRSKEDTDV